MICIVTQHFNLNRIILLLVGLWPYENSKIVQFQIIFCFSILISTVGYQLAVFISEDCTIDLILKVVSIALFFSLYVIEYNSFRINREILKWSLEYLQHICNELKDEKEIDIMKQCGVNSRRYTTMLILLHVMNLIALILIPFVLYIYDVVMCINKYHLSRIMQMLIPKYFIGRENYFYLIILHTGSAIIIGGIILVSTMSMCVGYIKHACGMFKIASYRIEKAIAINRLKNVSLDTEIIMYKKLIHAVDIHRKAIKSTILFFSGFQRSRFIIIIISVLTLSLNLYGISEAFLLGQSTQDFIYHFLIVVDLFIYIFLFNYAGQEFMDHNDHIFSTVYNVRWYVTPIHVQKLMLFLLQRGNKTVSLNFGIMFVLSLELFAALTKLSISYFTVVCSMQ